jgi:hypothetical protein
MKLVVLFALCLGVALPALAQQDSRGGVTVSAYVDHNNNLDGLHVTISNDNSYSVSQIGYLVSWSCAGSDGVIGSSGTESPTHKNSIGAQNPYSFLAAGASNTDDLNFCGGHFIINSVRLMTFLKGN